MENSEKPKSDVEQAGEDLFNYAIDREDVKWLMTHLPEKADIKRTTVEYELPILKIISVGMFIATVSRVKEYLEAIKLKLR